LHFTLEPETANLFGKESAVESLIKGEAIGKHDYIEALESEDALLPECGNLIQSVLLTRVQHHITLLESVEESIG
jgi:hypothetical protein